jgi:hypothetical protein
MYEHTYIHTRDVFGTFLAAFFFQTISAWHRFGIDNEGIKVQYFLATWSTAVNTKRDGAFIVTFFAKG